MDHKLHEFLDNVLDLHIGCSLVCPVISSGMIAISIASTVYDFIIVVSVRLPCPWKDGKSFDNCSSLLW